MRTWPLPSAKEGFVTWLVSELAAVAARGDPSTMTRSTFPLRDKASTALEGEAALGKIVFDWRWAYEPSFDPVELARRGLRMPLEPLRVMDDGSVIGLPQLGGGRKDMPDNATGDVVIPGEAAKVDDGVRRAAPVGMAELSAAAPNKEMRPGDWQVRKECGRRGAVVVCVEETSLLTCLRAFYRFTCTSSRLVSCAQSSGTERRRLLSTSLSAVRSSTLRSTVTQRLASLTST
jgi:hypothetical protein